MELNIEKFSPTIAELQKLVKQTEDIKATDLKDKKQLKVVKENRLQLRDARVAIEKTGKVLRADALIFQKAVIAKEKELIAIVEPEELRLKGIEEEADRLVEVEKRRESLPNRIEILKSLSIELPEAEILAMDDEQFTEFKNIKIAEKQEAERISLEVEKRKVEEEKSRLVREEQIRQEERARVELLEKSLKEERERAEREAKERIVREEQESRDRIIRQEKEAKERLELEKREREEADARIKEDAKRKEREEEEMKKKLEKDKKYQEFLTTHGWTKDKAGEFYIELKDRTYSLYKKVGEITL